MLVKVGLMLNGDGVECLMLVMVVLIVMVNVDVDIGV